MLQIIQKRKIWLTFSGILVVLSIIALSLWGLKFGIDFTGGSLMEVKIPGNPAPTEIQSALSSLNLKSFSIQQTETGTDILRFQESSEDIHKQITEKLNNLAAKDNGNANSGVTVSSQGGNKGDITVETDKSKTVEELRFDSIGPSIGNELKGKAFNSLMIVLVIITLYIALAFRKVSKPVESWKYGVAAIVAIFHDVLITIGIFSALGHFYGVEINSPFVAAILTILGYSINDTIVVFDRIRENLPKSEDDYETTVNRSINQTLARSINTSLTVFIVLVSILIFGGNTIRDFVLALTIGVFYGTYSSIFVASPLVVIWEKFKK